MKFRKDMFLYQVWIVLMQFDRGDHFDLVKILDKPEEYTPRSYTYFVIMM